MTFILPKSAPRALISIVLTLLLGGFFSPVYAQNNKLSVPNAYTQGSINVSFNSATVRGQVRPGGIAPTTYWVEWGVTQALGRITEKLTDPRLDSFQFQIELTNLNPETRYYFRVVGENQFGRSTGNINNFTTKKFGDKPVIYGSNTKTQCNDDFDNDGDGLIDLRDPGCENSRDDSERTNFGFVDSSSVLPPPIATTKTANVINGTTAILNGRASMPTSTGTDVWFEWSDSPTTLDQNITRKQNNGLLASFDFSDTLLALKPDAIYYYRAVVANIYGISKGDVLTFTTRFVAPLAASATTQSPTSIGGAIFQAVKGQGGTSINAPVTPTPIIAPIAPERPAISMIKEVINQTKPNGTASAVSASGGETIDFVITLKNTGTQTLTNLILKDSVPPTLEFLNATKGSLYSNMTSEITWIISDLKPEESIKLGVRTRTRSIESGALVGTRASVKNELVFQESNEALVIVNPSAGALAILGPDDNSIIKDLDQPAKVGEDAGTASAIGSFGQNILPSSLGGWVILAVLVFGLLLLARYVYSAFYKRSKDEKDALMFDEDDFEVETHSGPKLIQPPGTNF
jgi:uncharacterized repeat protein (TIGR01451 family)